MGRSAQKLQLKNFLIFYSCVTYTNSSVPAKFSENISSGSFQEPPQNTPAFIMEIYKKFQLFILYYKTLVLILSWRTPFIFYFMSILK